MASVASPVPAAWQNTDDGLIIHIQQRSHMWNDPSQSAWAIDNIGYIVLHK